MLTNRLFSSLFRVLYADYNPKWLKITTGKWCFAAWRIDKATSDSVNASEAGENFAATNHTDDVFTFIGI